MSVRFFFLEGSIINILPWGCVQRQRRWSLRTRRRGFQHLATFHFEPTCLRLQSATNGHGFPSQKSHTLPKTNIAPENGWFGSWKTFSFPFGMAQPGRCELLVSGTVSDRVILAQRYISAGSISMRGKKTGCLDPIYILG